MGSVNIDKIALLALEGPDGPFVMVNLFRLKDETQFGEYLRAMMDISGPTLGELKAETLYAGTVGSELITGENHWHKVVLVRYPNWKLFCATLADGGLFDRLTAVRRQYLDDWRFMLTTALDGSSPRPSE